MFSSVWTWITNVWGGFEAWINGWFPGAKVKIVNALTVLGTTATAITAYLQAVPFDSVVNAKTLAWAMIIVSTLSFWLRGIGDRVDSRS